VVPTCVENKNGVLGGVETIFFVPANANEFQILQVEMAWQMSRTMGILSWVDDI
jgi:hypothetical protein